MLLDAITFVLLFEIFIKRRKLRWTGSVACTREPNHAYKTVVRKPEIKMPFRRHKEDER
jgi:hypothetical protein